MMWFKKADACIQDDDIVIIRCDGTRNRLIYLHVPVNGMDTRVIQYLELLWVATSHSELMPCRI